MKAKIVRQSAPGHNVAGVAAVWVVPQTAVLPSWQRETQALHSMAECAGHSAPEKGAQRSVRQRGAAKSATPKTAESNALACLVHMDVTGPIAAQGASAIIVRGGAGGIIAVIIAWGKSAADLTRQENRTLT